MQRTDAASNDNDYGRIYWESHSGTLTGQISVARQSAENDGYMLFKTAASGSLAERLRITNANAWGIAGANYGTSGQVLTSGGSGAAPSWTTISAAPAISTKNLSLEFGEIVNNAPASAAELTTIKEAPTTTAGNVSVFASVAILT